MKKTLTMIFATLFAISVMGQHTNVKTRFNAHEKQKDLENFRGLFCRSGKDVIHHHKQHKTSMVTQLKSAMVIKQRLDSLIWESWDESSSKWVAEEKDEYTCDANGNMTLYAVYSWDEFTTKWVGNEKEEYTYDANGNKTLLIYSHWDETTSKWVGNEKEEYTYDTNEKMTVSIGSHWDESTSKWVAEVKNEYTYDANGKMTVSIGSNWDETTSKWVVYDKEEYTYDANGNMTLYVYSNWDESSTKWVVYEKEEYTYDANGNMTLYVYSNWDESTSKWVGNEKEEYTYDANANRTLYIDSNWDESTSKWVGNEKEEYTYDVIKNMTLFIHSNWDESTSKWVGDNKEEYTYNNSYSFADLILPAYLYEYEEHFNHMLVHFNSYSYYDTDWILDSKVSLYYSAQNITNVSDYYKANCINIFPNPASDYVTIALNGDLKNSTIDIYDMQGRKVKSQIISNNVPVSVQNLPKGLYLYKLNANGIIYKGKLMIE